MTELDKVFRRNENFVHRRIEGEDTLVAADRLDMTPLCALGAEAAA